MKLIMSSIQQKITRYVKKQGTVIHYQKKNQSDPEITKVMELAGKNFQIDITNTFKNFKKNLNVTLKEMETIEKNWT